MCNSTTFALRHTQISLSGILRHVRPPSRHLLLNTHDTNMEFLQLSGPLLDIFLFFSKTKIFHSHPWKLLCVKLQNVVFSFLCICSCVCFSVCVDEGRGRRGDEGEGGGRGCVCMVVCLCVRLFCFVLFLIPVSIIWICLSNELCLAGRPAGQHGKNLNDGHYGQTVQPKFSIGTIDFYHFTPNLLSLTLLEGSEDQSKTNPIGFIFSPTFHVIRTFDVVMKQFRLNSLGLLLSHICWKKGNKCCFPDYVKQIFNVGMRLDVYEWIWFKLDMMIDDRYCCTLHFNASLMDLDIDSRSQECKTEKTCVVIILQSFQSVWIKFGALLRFVGVVNLILLFFFFCLAFLVFKGENPTYVILLREL